MKEFVFEIVLFTSFILFLIDLIYFLNNILVKILFELQDNFYIKNKLVNRTFKYSLFFFFVLLISFGCSTKKNTVISRFHHGLTTKYNILFNGTESYKEGIKKYERSYIDDYSQVLPVFIYGDKQLSDGIKSSMDRTIEKSTKSIRLHSITKKPEQSKDAMSEKDKAFYSKNEYNIFIDDSYLIMGKAFFYQTDYLSAIRIFNYIINQYDDIESKYMAYNWMVRANTELKDFREAHNILEFLQTEIDYPEKLNYDLNLTFADYYLKQQKYDDAELYIAEALTLVKRKKQKIRLTYIYAQLKEKSNNLKEASELFKDVMKMNPPYEMTFNAKLKRAALYSGGAKKDIKDDLLDMLKDDKNIEYHDQIYFALGEIENRNGDINEAIKYYLQSAGSSTSNTNQKGITYLTLANIFFDQTKYMESQAYFDSAVVSLEKDFPGYSELAQKNKYLSKLVNNLRTVSHQDSIQIVAKMPEKERMAFIQQIIQDLSKKEQEERDLQKAQELEDMGGQIRSTRSTNQLSESGKWYFYNQSAKSFGEPEFKRRWGTRTLEDNWRRRNKRILGFEQITESEFSDDIINPKEGLDNKKSEYYMIELPLTDSAMKISHKKIQNALFNVGEVYRNDLKDYPMALDAYNDLIDRYPEGEYKVAAYYSIYKVYLVQDEIDKAGVYKSMIIRNYPETKYAKVLIDPNYSKKFEQEETDKKNYYTTTLDLYRNGNFSEVINRCNYGINKYTGSEYIPKYSYLKAISIGEIYGVTVLKPELEKIINEYKNDPVAEQSENLLAAIKENELGNLKDINLTMKSDSVNKDDEIQRIVTQKTLEEIAKIYTYNQKSEHVLAVVIANEADINQLKFNIINFNLDFYIQETFEVENKEFNEFSTIVVIKQFKDAESGMEYFEKFKLEKERVFKDVKSSEYQFFSISNANLDNLIKEKMVRDYLLFYKMNYLE